MNPDEIRKLRKTNEGRSILHAFDPCLSIDRDRGKKMKEMAKNASFSPF